MPHDLFDPQVSVVIPCYNNSATIRQAVESALQQSISNIEVLIVDDGSTDGTPNVLKAIHDSRVRCFSQANSGGPAAPRNLGILESKGEWVALLDADDCWDTDKLERCLAIANGGVDVVMHSMRISIDGKSVPRDRMPILKTRAPRDTTTWYECLRSRPPVAPPSGTMIRRSLLLKHGGFDCDPRLVACEDYDLWLRLAKGGAQLVVTSSVLGTYAAGPGHLSSPARTVQSLPLIVERYFHSCCTSEVPAWIHVSMGAASWRLRGVKGLVGFGLNLMRKTPWTRKPVLALGILVELLRRAYMISGVDFAMTFARWSSPSSGRPATTSKSVTTYE